MKRKTEGLSERTTPSEALTLSLGDRMATLEYAMHDLIQKPTRLGGQFERMERTILAPLAQGAPDPKRLVDYQQLILRVRELVQDLVPSDATVLVISKGDDELLNLDGRRAWHFPQTDDGTYAGSHPASSLAAIAQLEALRHRGADYLVLPTPTYWWLDHYAAFRHHLERAYRKAVYQEESCLIYSLREAATDEPGGLSVLRAVIAQCRASFGNAPAILDWETGLELKTLFPDLTVFSPPERVAVLPYFDQSIDVVAIPSSAPEQLAEARRTASTAVVTLRPSGTQGSGDFDVDVEWSSAGETGRTPFPSVSIVVLNRDPPGKPEDFLALLRKSLPCDFRGEILLSTPPIALDCPSGPESLDGQSPGRAEDFDEDTLRSLAREASGDILVFVDSRTIPLHGWLTTLVETFRGQIRIGIVGGRLVAPDGRLRSAGGIIFADGSLADFGGGDPDPEAPLYSFVRNHDYCPASFLATRRTLFEELAGLDPAFQNPTYRVADYCLRAQARGYRSVYQPESTIVCLSRTIGTEMAFKGSIATAGEDQARFRARWRAVLRHRPDHPRFFDREVWRMLAAQGAGGTRGILSS